MAQANVNIITSRFHNLSNEALADALGHADAILKGAEAECKALKDEFKRRGLIDTCDRVRPVPCRPGQTIKPALEINLAV